MMAPDEALEWLRSQVEELQSRRPGCADKTCSTCKRFAVEDKHTAEALSVIKHLIEGMSDAGDENQ